MSSRDRTTGLLLLGLALLAWIAVAWLLVSRSPVGQPLVQLAGAVAIGTAVGISLWPAFWLVDAVRAGRPGEGDDPDGVAVRRAPRPRGDWSTAGRRALVAGLTVGVLVMLRGQGVLGLPLAIFVVTLAVLVEVAFTVRR
ncbi:MAG: hypothetical protein U0869_12745 [Chloroflexota bacterium]